MKLFTLQLFNKKVRIAYHTIQNIKRVLKTKVFIKKLRLGLLEKRCQTLIREFKQLQYRNKNKDKELEKVIEALGKIKPKVKRAMFEEYLRRS